LLYAHALTPLKLSTQHHATDKGRAVFLYQGRSACSLMQIKGLGTCLKIEDDAASPYASGNNAGNVRRLL